ncbi:MAG: hypothetical protein GX772_08395, partial [Alcaligenaceae bacterium]|nr:hypothetical protein [Alcaligenaceae bacterium]
GYGRPQGARKPEWNGERKSDRQPSEWKAGPRPEWKADRRPEGRSEWQPGRAREGKPEWKGERRSEWSNDRKPRGAEGAHRPGRPTTRSADRSAAPRRADRPQRNTARF